MTGYADIPPCTLLDTEMHYRESASTRWHDRALYHQCSSRTLIKHYLWRIIIMIH